jgi:hypothetical protein
MEYSAEDLENMRTMIKTLYLFDEMHMQMSAYERADIAEKMLQTYVSQGIVYQDLQKIFAKGLDSTVD